MRANSCSPQTRPAFFFPLISTLLLVVSGIFPASRASAAAVTLTIDVLTDSNAAALQACTPAPADCSLRGAISKANADAANTYTLQLPAGTYPLTLPGVEDANAGGDLDIKRDLVIEGAGPSITIINGSQIDRVFQVFSGAVVTLRDLQVTGGKAATPPGESPRAPAAGEFTTWVH